MHKLGIMVMKQKNFTLSERKNSTGQLTMEKRVFFHSKNSNLHQRDYFQMNGQMMEDYNYDSSLLSKQLLLQKPRGPVQLHFTYNYN